MQGSVEYGLNMHMLYGLKVRKGWGVCVCVEWGGGGVCVCGGGGDGGGEWGRDGVRVQCGGGGGGARGS